MSEKSKKKLGSLVRIFISFAFLAALFYLMRDKLPEVWRVAHNARKDYLFSAVAIFFVPFIFFYIVRLKLVFDIQKIKFSFRFLYFIRLIGYFFNNFLPSAVGGDFVSAYLAAKRTDKPIPCFTAIFFDRIIGFFTIFVLALVAILIQHSHLPFKQVKSFVFFMLFFIVFLPFFSFSKRVAKPFKILIAWLPEKAIEKLRAAYHAIYQYRNHPIPLIYILLCSVFVQGLSIVVTYLCAKSLGMTVTFLNCLVLTPLVWVVAMLPSLGGLGLREGAYVVLFKNFGGSEKAFAMSILLYALTIVASVIGGLLYVFFAGKVPSEAVEDMKKEDLKELEKEKINVK